MLKTGPSGSPSRACHLRISCSPASLIVSRNEISARHSMMSVGLSFFISARGTPVTVINSFRSCICTAEPDFSVEDRFRISAENTNHIFTSTLANLAS